MADIVDYGTRDISGRSGTLSIKGEGVFGKYLQEATAGGGIETIHVVSRDGYNKVALVVSGHAITETSKATSAFYGFSRLHETNREAKAALDRTGHYQDDIEALGAMVVAEKEPGRFSSAQTAEITRNATQALGRMSAAIQGIRFMDPTEVKVSTALRSYAAEVGRSGGIQLAGAARGAEAGSSVPAFESSAASGPSGVATAVGPQSGPSAAPHVAPVSPDDRGGSAIDASFRVSVDGRKSRTFHLSENMKKAFEAALPGELEAYMTEYPRTVKLSYDSRTGSFAVPSREGGVVIVQSEGLGRAALHADRGFTQNSGFTRGDPAKIAQVQSFEGSMMQAVREGVQVVDIRRGAGERERTPEAGSAAVAPQAPTAAGPQSGTVAGGESAASVAADVASQAVAEPTRAIWCQNIADYSQFTLRVTQKEYETLAAYDRNFAGASGQTMIHRAPNGAYLLKGRAFDDETSYFLDAVLAVGGNSKNFTPENRAEWYEYIGFNQVQHGVPAGRTAEEAAPREAGGGGGQDQSRSHGDGHHDGRWVADPSLFGGADMREMSDAEAARVEEEMLRQALAASQQTHAAGESRRKKAGAGAEPAAAAGGSSRASVAGGSSRAAVGDRIAYGDIVAITKRASGMLREVRTEREYMVQNQALGMPEAMARDAARHTNAGNVRRVYDVLADLRRELGNPSEFPPLVKKPEIRECEGFSDRSVEALQQVAGSLDRIPDYLVRQATRAGHSTDSHLRSNVQRELAPAACALHGVTNAGMVPDRWRQGVARPAQAALTSTVTVRSDISLFDGIQAGVSEAELGALQSVMGDFNTYENHGPRVIGMGQAEPSVYGADTTQNFINQPAGEFILRLAEDAACIRPFDPADRARLVAEIQRGPLHPAPPASLSGAMAQELDRGPAQGRG